VRSQHPHDTSVAAALAGRRSWVGGRSTWWLSRSPPGSGVDSHGPAHVVLAMIFTTYAGMDIGSDNGGVVDLA
jgi:hypothetical protein